ncbi:hypothetical protein RUM44_012886 [Polyplax serrata]|uniref:Importin N-terminal domain-containing protein n=1 Tax=Polyplax serrata TaxID=468196 RepID=A0ABR1BGE3_POLSC
MALNKVELIALEQLLNQFFDVKTGNEKRHEIERLLGTFESQHGSWKLCIEYLATTRNQYVSMFCLTTIENIINRQWMSLPWEEKVQLKSLLYSYLLENQKALSICIRSKLVKLVVDIARIDWPHFYPDFFVNVLHLLQKPETRSLGLLFMLTTSEELIAPREDLSVDRKNELKKLLLAHMPDVFSILSDFLSNETILSDVQDCVLLLRVFTHLFSWVPAAHVPNTLISILFKLGSKIDKQDVASLAVNTLNEMLYRHWVPPSWNEIINHTMELLQTLLSSSLVKLDYGYLEKVTEFLRLVLGMEVCQNMEKQDNLTALLSATLSLTFQQPTVDPGFVTCLDIWMHLLEHSNSKKHHAAFVSLAQQILRKIQFRENRLELSKVEESQSDEDDDASWSKILKTCIEIVAKIAEFQPNEILQLVFEQWVQLCNLYGQFFQTADVSSLYALLIDLSSFTQAMGRLFPQCTGESWKDEPHFSIGRLTVQHLLILQELIQKVQPHSLPHKAKFQLQNLHCEVLASLKSWCYWLSLLSTEDSMKSILNDFMTGIINGCVPLLNPASPIMLQHCAAHLLSTVTSTVRPYGLWNMENIKCLFSTNLDYLQKEDQNLVHGSLVNCLILKWPNAEDQMWDHRLKLLTSYINELTKQFNALPLQFNLEYKPLIINSLQMLQYIIMLYKSEGTKSKKLLCMAFEKSVEHCLALFPIYVRDAEVNQEILQFFLILLECLQQQVGVPFTQLTVQIFMDCYTRQQLQVSLGLENGGGLQQLLQILDLVVQTPGLSASKLTPMAVNLCLQLSEPILSPNVSPAVQESLFQLVYSILVHKWHYFFKATLEADVRKKEFLQLMKSIGQSLFLQNIDLFRQNLKNLERLNNKWNLYYKEVFKKDLHGEFLIALLNILLTKSHTLVNDEIAVVIYNLIIVDANSFFDVFLPKYLDSIGMLNVSQKTVLLDNFTRDTDMPSMIQNIFRLINDLICYQSCNSGFSATHQILG